jgi:hypothetical protein
MKLLALAILAVLTSSAYSVAGQFSVCSNATGIPSTTVFPFVTENSVDVSLDCVYGDFAYICPSFGYSWIPDVSGVYDFRVESRSILYRRVQLAIYQGSKCDSLNFVDFGSQYGIVTRTVEVEAGMKYFFNFTVLDIRNTYELYFSLDRTPVPPECVGAIAVDPLMDEVVIGNVTNAVPGVFPLDLGCGVDQYSRGLWYKIENWTHSELGVLLSIPSKVVEEI